MEREIGNYRAGKPKETPGGGEKRAGMSQKPVLIELAVLEMYESARKKPGPAHFKGDKKMEFVE